jgi:hypothetical protein
MRLKCTALTKIIQNNQKCFNGVFNQWRKMTKINKLYNFERIMNQFVP